MVKDTHSFCQNSLQELLYSSLELICKMEFQLPLKCTHANR